MRHLRCPKGLWVTGLSLALGAAAIATLSQMDALAQQAQSRTVAQRPLPRPVVDAHHLMHLFNLPVYEYLKESVATQPADADAWQVIQERGLQVAEVANLVAIRQEARIHPQWTAVAGDLQTAAMRLTDAAKAQNWEATRESYALVIQQCNRCHEAAAPDKAPKVEP